MVLIGIHIFVFVPRGAYQRDALPFSLKENKFIIIIIIIKWQWVCYHVCKRGLGL
jgi:hypothetical protein